MNHAKRVLLLLCSLVVGATQAQAAGIHGVLSGLAVRYNNPSGLTIDTGSAYVDGTAIAAIATQSGAPSTFCVTHLVNTANTAYYVYYFSDATNYTGFAISTTSPTADGHPGAALTGTGGCGLHNLNNQTDGIFLGSFINDNSGSMVPFERNAQEVLLMPKNDTGTTRYGGDGSVQQTFPKAPAAYPTVLTFDFDSGTVKPPLPVSATAVIVDFQIQDNGNTRGTAETFYVLDPHFNTLTTCTPHSELTMSLTATAANLGVSYLHAKLRNDGSKLYVGACTAPPTQTVAMTAYYVGYVEPVQHITNL